MELLQYGASDDDESTERKDSSLPLWQVLESTGDESENELESKSRDNDATFNISSPNKEILMSASDLFNNIVETPDFLKYKKFSLPCDGIEICNR